MKTLSILFAMLFAFVVVSNATPTTGTGSTVVSATVVHAPITVAMSAPTIDLGDFVAGGSCGSDVVTATASTGTDTNPVSFTWSISGDSQFTLGTPSTSGLVSTQPFTFCPGQVVGTFDATISVVVDYL